MPLAKTSSFPLCPDRRPGPSLSGNASVVSDAPHDRWAGRLGKSGGARPIQLFEGSRPWAGGDSMQFESTLASKALPGREFSHNPVIDSHRYMSSLQPCALSYLGAIRSSRGKIRRMCLYTRKRLPRSGFVQTGLEEINGDLLEADLWGVRGSHRNKGVSQAGFTYRPSPGITTGMGRASVGMFRFPQSVNCSVRRPFGYSLLFCAFLRTK
jgi:hypothetical protein